MTTAERPQTEGSRSIFDPERRNASFGILILITLIAFEAMAVSAALPTAARELHGLGEYGWAFTGFLVANIVAMVASGQLCDARGPRLALVLGLACFVAGLVLAGTAPEMLQLVAGRVVQGLGGGLIITAIYVVIGEVYPSSVRPALFAATSSAWVVPSLVGPAVSGLVTQHASWRWVFLGLVPFVLAGAALMVPVLRRLADHDAKLPAQDSRRALRRLGAAFAVAGGLALLEEAGQHPRVVTGVAAVSGLGALVWGLRIVLPPGTFQARPGVAAPVALRGLLAGAFFGAEVIVPLSLTVQHGYGATAAGLPLACAGVSWATGSWIQGRADDSRGPRVRVRLIRSGFACVAVGTAGIAVAVVPASPGWLAYLAWLVSGLGAGLAMSSSSVLLLNYTTDADRGADSAALQLSDATANAITTGIAGVAIAAAARGAVSFTTAFVLQAALMSLIAAAGAVVAGRARPARRATGAAGAP